MNPLPPPPLIMPLTRTVSIKNCIFLFLQHGFKTFLGISPQVAGWNSAGDEFSLIIENNPLAEFVELPEGHGNLWYSSILIGVIKGALQMVYMQSFYIYFTSSHSRISLSKALSGGGASHSSDLANVRDILSQVSILVVKSNKINKLA